MIELFSFVHDYWQWIIPGLIMIFGLLFASYVFRNWHLLVPAASLFAAMLAVGKAFSKGSDSERQRHELAQKQAVKKIKEAQRDVERLDDQQVKDELLKWSRK